MQLPTPLIFAYQSIIKQKTRFVLTVLSMSIGIALVMVVFSASYGLQAMINGQLAKFGTGIIEIETKVPNTDKSSNENSTGQAQGIVITTFKNKDLDAIKAHPNISYIYGAVSGQEAVSYNEKLIKTFVMGIGSEAPDVDGSKVQSGRFFTKEEDYSLSQVAVLGYKAWNKLFDGDDAVGKSISIRGKKFRIVGVMEERGSALFVDLDDQIFIPLNTMQKRILGTDYVSFATAKMIDSSKTLDTQADIMDIMRNQHDITDPNKDDFAVNTMDEAQDILGSIISSVAVLLIALVGISLVIGGVGIMNIMYVSVAERSFEIGLRKSFGARARDILWQFLTESLVVTGTGGVVGIIIGALLAYGVSVIAISNGYTWEYRISLISIVIAVGFSVFVGLVFGLYPAKKAAALNPIEALRKE